MFTLAVSTLFTQTELVKLFEFYIGRHGKQYNIVIYFICISIVFRIKMDMNFLNTVVAIYPNTPPNAFPSRFVDNPKFATNII